MIDRNAWLVGFAALLASCASEASGFRPSGFLSDYSQLTEHEGESGLMYYNETADFTVYDKVLIEPITIWAPKSSDIAVPMDELDMLCKQMYASLKEAISEHKQVVESPGPGTARIRLAITEAVDQDVALNLITTIMPAALILGEGFTIASGTRLFVGAASIEGEISDSLTGEVLIAGVERRQGGKDLSTGELTHVKEAMDVWAQDVVTMIRERTEASAAAKRR